MGAILSPAGEACLSTGPVTIRAGLFIGSGATFVLGPDQRRRGDSGLQRLLDGIHPQHGERLVNLNDNVLVDPDGNEYVTNRIHGTLKCHGNSPAPQVGDSEGNLNHVTGAKTGQCTSV